MNNKYFYKDEVDLIWEDCIYVFDTSVILSFYDFSKKYIYELLDNQLPKLGTNNIILPGHVYYEYLKNRERIINKNFYYNECVEKLENENLKCIEQIINNVNEISKITINKDKHPYLDNEKLNQLQTKSTQYQDDYQKILNDIKEEIDTRKKEINNLMNSDIILEKVRKNFTIEKNYKFDKYIEILKEAKERCEFEIPPGFSDYKEKHGIQKCGDLVIWKQILELSKINKTNIIFITNDVKKNDWCYIDNRGRVTEPKEEIIKEFVDKTNKRIWIYTFEQFLYEIKNRKLVDINEKLIAEAKANNYEEFTAIDIETTGLSPSRNEIIAIDAIKYRYGKKVDMFSSMVKPENEIPTYITKIIGITKEDLNNAPNITDVMEKFKKFVGKDTIVGHNIGFDLAFLNQYSNDYFKEHRAIDTVILSKRIYPHLPNYRLRTIEKYIKLNINDCETNGQRDCQCAAEIYLKRKFRKLVLLYNFM